MRFTALYSSSKRYWTQTAFRLKVLRDAFENHALVAEMLARRIVQGIDLLGHWQRFPILAGTMYRDAYRESAAQIVLRA